jgi:hypothetical protein
MGLISQADDEGRLNGHPALIKSLIFTYDHDLTLKKVEELLELLASRKIILRYEIDQQKYIFITNFKKHQTINKPQHSKLPDHNDAEYGSNTVVIPEQSVNGHAQKKLKEVKLKEVKLKEVKLSEDDISPEGDTHAKTIPPKIEDVRNYCEERKNNIDPESWYDHYEAKGWMIGKNKMKDWKAGVRTWEKGNLKHTPTLVPKDKILESRKREIALNQWISKGNDPDEFDYNTASNH